MSEEEKTKNQLEKDNKVLKSRLPEILSEILDGGVDEDLDFEVIFRSDMSGDRFNRRKKEIHYGLNNHSLENLKVARKKLVHEAIHAAGIYHNHRMRSINFYSKLSRDLFTNKIMEKLGWEPPTEGEIRRHHRRKGKQDYKYVAYCPKCGEKWYRKKKSKLIKQPDKYYCKKCEVNLKSRELSEEEKRDLYEELT